MPRKKPHIPLPGQHRPPSRGPNPDLPPVPGLASQSTANAPPRTELLDPIATTLPDAADVTHSSPDQPRYVSRINIIDAFQYPGTLAQAPAWIDRNWVGYADADYIRGIDASPVLRVPSPADPTNVVTIARVGDYVCRQSVLLDPTILPEIRVEVWSKEQFQRLFIPDRRPPVIGQSRPAGKPLTDHDPQAIDALNAERRRIAAAQIGNLEGDPAGSNPHTDDYLAGQIPGPTHGGLGEVSVDAPDEEITVDLRSQSTSTPPVKPD